jgi:lysine-N-methylase
MAVLGFFCEEATDLQMKGDFLAYADLVAKHEELLEDESLMQAVDSIQSYPQVQVKVFSGILFSKLLKSNTRHQKIVLEEFSKGIFGAAASMSQDAFQALMLEKYLQGIRHLEHILTASNTRHFVANFLANQMFNEAFPFNEANFFKSYLRLVSRFGSLRMLLALRCSDPADLPTPQGLAALTQVYARKFEHDQAFKSSVNEALHVAGFESMKYVVGLIRD